MSHDVFCDGPDCSAWAHLFVSTQPDVPKANHLVDIASVGEGGIQGTWKLVHYRSRKFHLCPVCAAKGITGEQLIGDDAKGWRY